jgi:chromosome segregation ATPase
MDNQIFELADRLKAAKDRKKELDAQLKETNAEIMELDTALSDLMAEQEVDKFSRNGNTFYLHSRLFASPAAGRKDELMQALKDNGYGSIVVETVNANTLASFVKEQKAMNGDEIPDWLDEVVSSYEKVSVGVRKG